MIAAAFDYHKPASVEEAIKLLVELGDEAKILAGGHSLIPMMKLRFASPEHLIDINGLSELSYISRDGDNFAIGALTREAMVEHNEDLISTFPIFADVTKLIADPQVRNMGTIGGNLAHGDAANDHPAVMIALNATIEITGPDGKRTVGIDDFFHGFYTTAVGETELLTSISIPIPPGKCGSAYHKMERKVGDYATAGVAVLLCFADDGTCASAGIGLTNVNPLPLRATRSQDVLVGNVITPELIDQAAQMASEDCNPTADLRGDEEYKRAMVKVITKRMINKAITLAKL